MSQGAKRKAREFLDLQLTYCFKFRDSIAAFLLIDYAYMLGVISVDEMAYLCRAVRCL